MIHKVRATVCAWFGHSRVATGFFGYQYCGRCSHQIGDSLGGVGVTNLYFPVHGSQDCCREIKASLTWKDWFMVPKKVRNEEEITPEKVKEARKTIQEATDKLKAENERLTGDAAGS